MLKEYVDDGNVKPVCSVGPSKEVSYDDNPEIEVNQNDNSDDKQHEYPMKLQNSVVLANLDLRRLSENVQFELQQLIHWREDIFPDVPSRTKAAYHDVDLGDHEAIKQHPYRVNPMKRVHLNKEIEYM